jgi:hypothetical protein
LKIIDFHVHPLPVISTKELLFEMNSASVEKAVLLSMDLDPGITRTKRLQKDIGRQFEYTNFLLDIDPIYNGMEFVLNMGHTPMEHVVELIKSNKDKFIGFGSLNIGYKSNRYIKQKLKQIKEMQEEFGFKGIKLLPTLQFFNPTEKGLQKVFKFAEKQDLIILYHTGCDPGPWEMPFLSKNGNPLLIEPLLRKFNVKVVLAHMGSYSARIPGIWLKEAVKLIHDYPHVFGDLSAVPYLTTQVDSINLFRKNGILKKILYGSDFPVTSAGVTLGMSSISEIVESSELLSQEEKENIFHTNAATLLNLDN